MDFNFIYHFAFHLTLTNILFSFPRLFLALLNLTFPFYFLNKTTFRNIAFIMDGNRRYASKMGISDSESKKLGFKKMLEIAQFCRRIGIEEVSFYALSKKNLLNRPEPELRRITELIEKEKDNLSDQNMRIVVHGQPELLSDRVKTYFNELQEKTKPYKFILNIFFGYSSLDEIKKKSGYEKNVEVLIRTSGERRLSDFLLRQVCGGCSIVFFKPYWPEFSVEMLSGILRKCEREKRLYYGNRILY